MSDDQMKQMLEELIRLAENTNSLVLDLTKRFDAFEQRFDTLEQRFDALERRFETFEQKVDGRLERIESPL